VRLDDRANGGGELALSVRQNPVRFAITQLGGRLVGRLDDPLGSLAELRDGTQGLRVAVGGGLDLVGKRERDSGLLPRRADELALLAYATRCISYGTHTLARTRTQHTITYPWQRGRERQGRWRRGKRP
jgi:hypothetical protein